MDFFNVDFDQFFILYEKKIERNSYKLKKKDLKLLSNPSILKIDIENIQKIPP
jgi:hypothetical protein